MDELPTPPYPFDEAGAALGMPSLQQLFFLPGDWSIYLLARYVPAIAEWLGIGAADYGSTYSASLSLIGWSLVTIALIVVWTAIKDLNSAMTRGVSTLYLETRRHIRMAIVRAKYRRGRKPRTEPAIEVTEMRSLDAAELRVLRLHGNVAPGYALAVSDIAERLAARGYEVRGVLERLQTLKLLQATVGGLDGETAYTLTPVGRALLHRTLSTRA